MPCGGIYPAKVDYKLIPGDQENCVVCNKSPKGEGYVYYCEEFDCWIHRRCVHGFLQTEEGKVVLEHKHAIHLIEEGSYG